MNSSSSLYLFICLSLCLHAFRQIHLTICPQVRAVPETVAIVMKPKLAGSGWWRLSEPYCPKKRRPATVLRPFRRPGNERGLYERLIQIGFDGSLLHDHTKVYVLNKRPRWRGIMKIDYFHGMYKGTPIAQMAREDELDVRAVDMINISKGFTAQRITNLQRRWRRWKMTAASEGAPNNKRKKAAEPEAKPMPRKKKKVADATPPPKPAAEST